MIYCDTSLLVAALTSEINSAAARQWLETPPAQQLVVSDWVATEFASALAMKMHRGAISHAQRQMVDRRWKALLATTFRRVSVRPRHFGLAETLVDSGGSGLRAGDALHLAITLDHGLSLATFDGAWPMRRDRSGSCWTSKVLDVRRTPY